jgi:hypothetical protein
MSSHFYGEPPPKAPAPAHVLEWQIDAANKREAEILLRLDYCGEGSYERQELGSELATVRALRTVAEHALTPEADPAQVERNRLFAEGLAAQRAKLAAIFAEASPEVKSEREANRLARLKQILDVREREALETLEAQAERCAREGDHRAARNFREQMLTVRTQLERECS